jgi:sulfite exporter TauE/SafE
MLAALSTGLLLGLGSAGHCAGMCGPIAMVLPFRSASGDFNWIKFTAYQSGRISTYLAIGLLIGSLGTIFPWQRTGAWLSVISGSSLVLYAFFYIGFLKFGGFASQQNVLRELTQQLWSKSIKGGHAAWFYTAGVANGLLPCGMVYAAAAAALGMRGFDESILLMAGFGLATLPVFLLLPILQQQAYFRRYFRKIIPIVLFGTGAWLIWRGLSFILNSVGDDVLSPMCVHGLPGVN